MRTFTCCCCGEPAPAFKQWWNRDTGYGICPRCFQQSVAREGPDLSIWLYGRPRVHHSVVVNARFWIWECDGWVKLTLKPGDFIRWDHFSRDEEGWSRRGAVWSWDGVTLTEHIGNDATDCDGRISSLNTFVATHLHAVRHIDQNDAEHFFDGEPILTPDWQRASSEQRDYAAEAMNY